MKARSFFVAFAVIVFAFAAYAAQPPEYTRQADFTDHTQNYPDVPQPGGDLDNEFNAVKTTLDAVLNNLELIQRDDGDLANESVGADQLTPELLALIGESELWETATAYVADDVVFVDNGIYRCLTGHTSGTFATDLAAGKWEIILDYGANVLRATSASSVAIGSGSKSFTIPANKYFTTSNFVMIASAAAPATNWMYGQVTAYSGTTLTVNVSLPGGSGTYADWNINVAGAPGPTGADGTIDLTSLLALTDVDMSQDLMLVYDSSDTANKKVAPVDFYKSIKNLSQDTDPSGTDDVMVTYESASGTAKKVALNEIFETINSLSTEASPNTGTDYLPIYNASSGQGRKILISTITASGGFITGVSYEWNGVFAPSGTLFENGAAVSRATYSDLLDAITAQVTGDTTNGNSTISNVNVDLRGLGLEGKSLEGTGIVGRTISSVTETTIVMSGTASASGTGVAIRIFPHGNGDGSTTFNVPDKRGRVKAGRDNMGGTSANRLTGLSGGIDGDVLGGTGGVESHVLTTGQLASHSHSAGTLAASTGGAHTHTLAVSTATGGGNFNGTFAGSGIPSNATTASNGDHTHTMSGSTGSEGSAQAHNNVQPVYIVNSVIGTGL